MSNYSSYLIGKCVTYSYSKIIHEAFGLVSYNLKALNEEDLISFINNKAYAFCNITNPYKEIVVKLLDKKDISVDATGVCNLIINNNNELIGYNTDYLGFLETLEYDIKDKTVLILGTGCTSKSITQALKEKQARTILFATRSNTNKMNNIYNYQDLKDIAHIVQVIINTTPNGTSGFNDDTLLNIKEYPKLEFVYDCVYNPYRTNLLMNLNKSIKFQNGLKMLIYQAWLSEKIYSNIYIKKEIPKLNNNIYTKLINITLIGMPSSGKTTIGKLLSNIYHKDFIDTDKEIEKIHNIKINEYLNKTNESTFRKMEEEYILNLNVHNMIISTGGGMVLNKTIMNYLKKYSIIIYLDKEQEELTLDNNHPLITSKEELIKTYQDRINLYKEYADYIIHNQDINSTIKKIQEII